MQPPAHTPRKFLSKRASCCLFGLVAGVGGIGFGFRALFSPLPWGCYPVLSTSRWVSRLPEPKAGPAYVWLFNGDLAYLEPNAQGKFQVCYQKMDTHGPVGAVRHGPELPSDVYYGTFWPSPNEQWLIYNPTPAVPGVYDTALMSADGKTTRTFSGLFMGWLPDNQRFLITSPAASLSALTIRHVDKSPPETFPITPSGEQPVPMETLPHGSDFLLGSTANLPSMTIRSLSLAQPPSIARTWHVSTPTDSYFTSFSAAPDRKHLLWTAYGKKQEGWRAWLGRFLPKLPADPLKNTSFFLSDMEGHNMHPILNRPISGTSGLNPTWTPDGKHLSFVYQNQLYLLPVD